MPIATLNSRLAKARDLLFEEKIESDDYKKIKKECEEKFRRLELELTEAKIQNSNLSSVDKMPLQAIEALSQLSSFYQACDVLKKRELLGSIFREKLRFDG